jgi:hypothetical protein
MNGIGDEVENVNASLETEYVKLEVFVVPSFVVAEKVKTEPVAALDWGVPESVAI